MKFHLNIFIINLISISNYKYEYQLFRHKKAGSILERVKDPALYPAPESNRHGFPQVFETSASTNSASWALLFQRVANVFKLS